VCAHGKLTAAILDSVWGMPSAWRGDGRAVIAGMRHDDDGADDDDHDEGQGGMMAGRRQRGSKGLDMESS
jgi:hypothetical protein